LWYRGRLDIRHEHQKEGQGRALAPPCILKIASKKVVLVLSRKKQISPLLAPFA